MKSASSAVLAWICAQMGSMKRKLQGPMSFIRKAASLGVEAAEQTVLQRPLNMWETRGKILYRNAAVAAVAGETEDPKPDAAKVRTNINFEEIISTN